jgi:hypothetical protein
MNCENHQEKVPTDKFLLKIKKTDLLMVYTGDPPTPRPFTHPLTWDIDLCTLSLANMARKYYLYPNPPI